MIKVITANSWVSIVNHDNKNGEINISFKLDTLGILDHKIEVPTFPVTITPDKTIKALKEEIVNKILKQL